MPYLKTWTTVGIAAVVVAAAIAVPVLTGGDAVPSAAERTPTATASTVPSVPDVDATALAALPEARYSAVVGGLLPVDRTVSSAEVFRLRADAPLFGSDRQHPVARFAAADFLGQPTTVVGLRHEGAWELVLTPARQELPSAADRHAAAQTAAWVPRDALVQQATPTSHVVISTADQTVSIVSSSGQASRSFPAGIGTSDTPTPTGVTGYLEQRYVDPAQGTGDHPIQLTSLHSSAADEPYGGSDGGLIGLHWNAAAAGAVSHGCVRLSSDGVAAIDALPLGTLVTVE